MYPRRKIADIDWKVGKMKFIRDLLGKKRRGEADPKREAPMESLEQSYRDTIGSLANERRPATRLVEATETAEVFEIAEEVAEAPVAPVALVEEPVVAEPAPAMNIWDLEDGGSSTELPTELPEPAVVPTPSAVAARSPARSRRTKTRLIGFEQSDGAVVDLFNDAPAAAAATASVKFPVGWIVVADGPGRGESFSLLSGMSQIGRGEDQAVQLDFGDNSISRTNHAAIVYDPDSKEFLLGHGGKSNIVRLNDKPVISNELIKTGDIIRIGDTVLRFIALCDKSFNWSDGSTEENEDVAIA